MESPIVNVAILKSEVIEFELHGNFTLEGTSDTFSGKYTAERKNDEVILKNESGEKTFKGNLKFIPENYNDDSFVIKDVIIGIQFHWQQKEKQRFLGSLQIVKEEDKITAVNIIGVEDYLVSVISSEMNANSTVEFLKAHAIISRSWLLAQIQKRNELTTADSEYSTKMETEEELIKWYDREDHTLYDVCADDHCQRYQGITKLAAHNSQIAVRATAGLVLTYDGKICDARFSKSCGGVVESFENVWEPVKHPYLAKVVDYKFEPDGYDLNLQDEYAATKWIKGNPPAFCNTKDEKILSQVLMDFDRETTDFYRWKVEYTQDEISELVNRKSGIDFGKITDLIPVERGVSGRLIKLKFVGTKKTLTIGKELEIRRILSETHLYSSAFTVEKKTDAEGNVSGFELTGAGWGHGVGLCQIGAAVMSEMGYSFDEILLHYFIDAKIDKLY